MLKQKKFPTVLFDDGSSFENISLDMLSFGRDSSVVPLEAAQGALYFGLYKPFTALYVEMKVVNDEDSALIVEYWNGSSWDSVESLVDDSDAFKRSGFIQFDKSEDWEETAVNGITAYFIRFRVSDDLGDETEIQGMNIVFSDDQDLKGVYPSILNFTDSNETSFILRHENSRDRVIETIRKIGRKRGNASLRYERYDAWDFLHIEEVRLWALYLTLENIFSGLQAKEEDLYTRKAAEYREKAEQYKADAFITLDADDDGESDNDEESKEIHSRRLVRR